MTIEIKKVPRWLVLGGIGHAVADIDKGWHYVACGVVTPNGDLKKRSPRRICRECRQVLRLPYVSVSDLSRSNQ